MCERTFQGLNLQLHENATLNNYVKRYMILCEFKFHKIIVLFVCE